VHTEVRIKNVLDTADIARDQDFSPTQPDGRYASVDYVAESLKITSGKYSLGHNGDKFRPVNSAKTLFPCAHLMNDDHD
jgi:hypothetical protein